MELFEEISKTNFSLLLISEKEYENKLVDLVRSIEKQNKICYVCLSKPYSDVVEQLIKRGVNINRFVFIDVLSSHYRKPQNVENCIFVDGPNKLWQLQEAISIAIRQKSCSSIIFDTISSLLIYEHTHNIIKFTHELTFELGHENINKVFIMLKDHSSLEGSENLIKDISMFADKTIDIGDHNAQKNTN